MMILTFFYRIENYSICIILEALDISRFVSFCFSRLSICKISKCFVFICIFVYHLLYKSIFLFFQKLLIFILSGCLTLIPFVTSFYDFSVKLLFWMSIPAWRKYTIKRMAKVQFFSQPHALIFRNRELKIEWWGTYR